MRTDPPLLPGEGWGEGTRSQGERRAGAATLELAIVLPLLVVMILFSLYFLELVRARLRAQEVSRSASWELAAQPLTDFREGRHEARFSDGAAQVAREVSGRYARNEGWGGSFIASYSNLRIQLAQGEVPWADVPLADGQEEGGWSSSIFGPLQRGARWALEAYGFNVKGLVRSEISLELQNRLLPRRFLDRGNGGWFRLGVSGGHALDRLPLKSRQTLIASDWHLAEGEDVVGGRRRSTGGQVDLPSDFHRQVSRMTFLGLRDRLNAVPGLSSAIQFAGRLLPDPTATYLISLNYGPGRAGDTRDCDYLRNYPPEARGGLANLARAGNLDHSRPACFDTAPFRDQAKYEDSLYVRMFQARGSFFMGCRRAQADDPTADRDASRGDESPRVSCG